MFLKKYNKNIKHRLAGLIAAIITVVIFSSCNIFSPVTNLYFNFHNMSSYDVVVEYEGVNTFGTSRTVSILSNTGERLFSFGYDGEESREFLEEEFSTHLNYFKVFIDDSLVYTQDPVDTALLSDPSIRGPGNDNITEYYYTFTFQDSLINYE